MKLYEYAVFAFRMAAVGFACLSLLGVLLNAAGGEASDIVFCSLLSAAACLAFGKLTAWMCELVECEDSPGRVKVNVRGES